MQRQCADCHAIIGKHITTSLRHLPCQPMVSHRKRHQRIYMTNQLMDNFYVLSGILIEKCAFWVSCQFNAKSGAVDQLTLGDQPVDRDRLVGQPWLRAVCLNDSSEGGIRLPSTYCTVLNSLSKKFLIFSVTDFVLQ